MLGLAIGLQDRRPDGRPERRRKERRELVKELSSRGRGAEFHLQSYDSRRSLTPVGGYQLKVEEEIVCNRW
jgi:hypothetical protein